MTSTVVSCPGKVLLAGGYLVLDPQHQGYVVSTPSRFHTTVEPVKTPAPTDSEHQFGVTVKSPQFTDGLWEFVAKRVDGEWTVDAVEREGGSSNSFVHLSIASTLLLASALSPSTNYSSLDITIVGSNDFYSQSRDDEVPIPFAPLNCTIRDVHKTGLGSSAAMVTSLTSALLLHWDSRSSLAVTPIAPTVLSTSPPPPARFKAPSKPTLDKATLTLIHNLAQYVHSLAQGKVGSGFDVSAAVYGSHIYRRFAVECLGDLLKPDTTDKKLTSKALLDVLSPVTNALWSRNPTSALVSPFSLPPGVILLLADVDAGSNTPSMVGKVLSWRKSQPEEADKLWSDLKTSNSALAETFGALTKRSSGDSQAYASEVEELSKLKSSEWSNSSFPFASAVQHIQTTRALMRKMGEASNVPIEPPEQTRLLDACSKIEGVVGAGVPGAGGYDAIWVLCLAPTTSLPELNVEKLLRSWTEMSVRPLSRTAWVKGGGVEGESGLQRETVDDVAGLGDAIARGKQ